MKIGEFAKACRTRVSVLRHYEKRGLLLPDHVDRFTGYRYYSPQQLPIFFRIQCLKQAGFSLEEIHTILASSPSDQQLLRHFDRKRELLLQALQDLEQARQMMLGGKAMSSIHIDPSNHPITASIPKAAQDNFDALCQELQSQLCSLGYQRTSGFRSSADSICCDVLRLNDSAIQLHDNIELPFVADDIVGRWEVIGEFTDKEEFLQHPQFGKPTSDIGDTHREIYFLPNGQRYWCYGWTKGTLLIDDGLSTSCNPYTKEKIDGEQYLFVDFKSYDYCRGGKPTILVLHQLDHEVYSADALSRKDNIDLPFVPDDAILGEWKAYSVCQSKELFDPTAAPVSNLFWKKVRFLPNGSCTLVYGEETISGNQEVGWTKGALLRRFNHCACAYELRTIADKEYLFIEWKSGDYRWGGFDTDYYVFIRSNAN